jgi:hypothetical protein
LKLPRRSEHKKFKAIYIKKELQTLPITFPISIQFFFLALSFTASRVHLDTYSYTADMRGERERIRERERAREKEVEVEGSEERKKQKEKIQRMYVI